MRAIYKIAKTELQMLFYSPIAWLLLLCFIFQTVFFYTGMLEGFVLDVENSGRTYWCSYRLFVMGHGGGSGLWPSVVKILYLYIPLLTMGVISKELSSGSIKLLYSSPISNTHIVLGKFLAMVAYAFFLTLILFVYVVFAWCTIDNFEWAWILTGLLGIFLLTCTYMAVGIFVSSLTSYQVISAVGTFIVLMLLGMVSGWGQQYDLVREITYWLGMNGRVNTFISGMLCSEDLIYFLTVIALFLMLTIIRLHSPETEIHDYALQKSRGDCFGLPSGFYFVTSGIVSLRGYDFHEKKHVDSRGSRDRGEIGWGIDDYFLRERA